MAVDPSYPLFPIFALLSAVLLLVLLTTNFVRHSWNLGVTFLCFWLFWENLFSAVSAIVWADNADLKLYVYCDIVSHLNVLTSIVKPVCTLIVTRRLYKIASLRTLMPESRRAKAKDTFIEWSLGFGLPVLVTGVFYYIVQGARFVIIEGAGCGSTMNFSGVDILLVQSPGIILPSISVIFYCPKIMYVFYRHNREANRFLRTNGSVSRSGYSRILAIGCLDILLTLPFGIMQIVSQSQGLSSEFPFRWYTGWSLTHSGWGPASIPWDDISQGTDWSMLFFYWDQWGSIFLALAIFALFGFTAESRGAYERGIYAALKLFGWTPSRPVQKYEGVGELHFAVRAMTTSDRRRRTTERLSPIPEREKKMQMPTKDFGRVPGLYRPPLDRLISVHRRMSVGSDPDENKSVSTGLRSGSPGIRLVADVEAQAGRYVSGDEKKSDVEGGGGSQAHTGAGDDDRSGVEAPRACVGSYEDLGTTKA